jgi:hypothetical protein
MYQFYLIQVHTCLLLRFRRIYYAFKSQQVEQVTLRTGDRDP